ncbi:MAG: hypothetical protein J3K34DRAFT_421929 [Monoraphidium minutum]|nr:MAG: hypothetical protein J3K34DRAFT_421929 [Monoraphidium minutum]
MPPPPSALRCLLPPAAGLLTPPPLHALYCTPNPLATVAAAFSWRSPQVVAARAALAAPAALAPGRRRLAPRPRPSVASALVSSECWPNPGSFSSTCCASCLHVAAAALGLRSHHRFSSRVAYFSRAPLTAHSLHWTAVRALTVDRLLPAPHHQHSLCCHKRFSASKRRHACL